MGDNKGRIIFLEHYIADHADESHPITTDELISAVAEKGYSANRNTIHSDIEALQTEGINIAGVRVANAKGYYVKNRPFRLSELKTLIDAVSSSQFIPEQKSNEMIRQLAEMAPEMYRKDLIATAFCADRIKTDSPVAFTALDTVNQAIQEQKKLRFRYVDYLPTKEEILRHNKKKYIVSPYALVWNDGRYYVPSYDPEKDKIVSYRVDRMRMVEIVNETADRHMPFDSVDYCKKVLWMFDGDIEEQKVMLISENRHMISLIDRFGEEIETRPVDDQQFRAIVQVIPSYSFFSWIFQFCGAIRIAGPENVRKKYEDMLRTVLERQQ